MEYRIATANDVAQLAAMNAQLILDEGHRNPMSLSELEQRMHEWLGSKYTAVLFVDSEIYVGYALYRRDPEYVYLRQFFVKAEVRRLGNRSRRGAMAA